MPKGNEDFFLAEIKEKLQLQYAEAKSNVAKASTLLGFIAVLIGIVSSVNLPGLTGNSFYLILSSITLLFLSMAISVVIAFFPIFDFRRDPEPRYFTENFFYENIQKTKEWLLRRLIESYEQNETTFKKVQSIFIISVILFVIALILIGLSLFS